MLELKNIIKDYPAGENVVRALKGIDIKFRNNEFVSILGQSGCGKTTLLNILGGLDKYTSGDLIINGVSTKDFKAKDWDTYRNHSIGFVFQSYNLIPHQTVLQNVELALSISGIKKADRKQRAIKALEEVGLGDQLSKKPAQMSGGQMQRVAIARALVNNPDIILADEPTGALDSETSIQVMNILKEISKERLVVMVTHNPELAEQYSSRIIRMLDGKIINDSNPILEEESKEIVKQDEKKAEADKNKKKPAMSFWTAFRLSLMNLFTKKARTILTSFAGSIGIIGIALILAVSQGMTGYINKVQRETLSTYPVTLEETSVDYTSFLNSIMHNDKDEVTHETNDTNVYQKSTLYNMANMMAGIETKENDLKSFKKFLDEKMEDKESELYNAVSGINYSYDLDLLVYTKHGDEIIKSDASELMTKLMSAMFGFDVSQMNSSSSNSVFSMDSMNSMASSVWQELLPGKNGDPINDLIKSQYDVVYGTLPNDYDEIVLILNENNEISDITLYTLGLLDESVINEVVEAIKNGTEIPKNENQKTSWSFEEMLGMECKVILNSDCFAYNTATNLYYDLRESDPYSFSLLYDKALTLKITGIIKPNKDATNSMITGSIGYTSALTKYVIDKVSNSDIVKAQVENSKLDIFTGKKFDEFLSNSEKNNRFREYAGKLSNEEKWNVFVQTQCIATDDEILDLYLQSQNLSFKEFMRNSLAGQGYDEDYIEQILSLDESVLRPQVIKNMGSQLKAYYVKAVSERLNTEYASYTPEQKAAIFDGFMASKTEEEVAVYYDNILGDYSNSTYEENLKKIGYIDLEKPTTINIYAASFEDKDVITNAIKDYNASVEENQQIAYTDYVALIMSSVTTIINAITYVLIAFVTISLIVSSIMVGVITLISVQERTKEIGILRAIGASKRDVSTMFNAETLIIGFASGAFGILITYLLCIPINLILHAVTGINSLSAVLNPLYALVLILISMVLTLISGLIPSRSAAKKDPVEALRTE